MLDDSPSDDNACRDDPCDDSQSNPTVDQPDAQVDSLSSRNLDAESPLDPRGLTQTFDYKKERQREDRPVQRKEPELEFKTLGKYRIVEQLGSGGMGVVYKAYDDALRRWVAIKTLSRTLSGAVVARRRFIREARAAVAIRHPNVVTIHAVEEEDGVPFIVMEYIEGCTLRDLRRDDKALTPMHILRISAQVAAGLAAAHVQGVIHRDVKPGNIMLEGEDRVVLTDFGLARAAVDNVELTSGAMPLGTPAYMSPEQVKGSIVDARSDLFSFGCVLYAMFVGHSPFQGQNALEVAKKVTDLSPRPLKDVDPRTPPFLSEIVERLLEKNPAKRYQSSLELLDVLNGHLAQLNQTPTDEFSTVLYQRSKPRRQSPPWLAVVTGIAVIALLTGVSFFKPWQAVQSQGKSEVGGEGELAVLPPRTIEVSKNGLAEFNSIQQALQVASPGSTIRVVDSGTYTEHIEFKGSKQLVVEAVAEPPAILLPLGPEFGIVSLTNVDEVTLRGFRLSVDNLHAIVLQDNCRSVTLDGLDFYQSDAGNATAMVLVNGGANADALTISNCHFVLDGNGQAIWISNGGPPLRNLRVERNRFRAKYTHLAIMRPVRNAIVRQNMFSGGKNGINLSMNEASQSEIPENCLQITNNSMVGVEYWLGVLGPVTDRQNYATVANNLLVDSGRLQGPVEELAKVASAWRFSANFWQHPPLKSADQERVKLLDLRMTSQLESVEVISKDLEDPRFGAPIEGDALYTEGVGGEFPKYVGAHGPAS